MEQRNCKHCGKSFAARSPTRAFCSRECRGNAARSGLISFRHSSYIPTPEQIAASCQEVQATWDEGTRRKRMGLPAEPEPWTPPMISCEEAGLGPNHEHERDKQE
jgi:hypothetical protein